MPWAACTIAAKARLPSARVVARSFAEHQERLVPPARAFLGWWEDRLRTECRHAVEEGLHREQRWADLAPSLFPDVGVLRDERVNVGHWNLPERSVEDVRLFRFSGYEPDAPDRATRYADRLATGALNGASEYFERYREALLDAGWEESLAWPYAFARFADGGQIPPLVRSLYDELGGERFGDPFAVGPRSLAAWLREPVDACWPAVSRLWMELHMRRADLRAAYPDPLAADRFAFARWTRETGAREHGLPETLDVRGAASLREHAPEVAFHIVVADELESGGSGVHGVRELGPATVERGLGSSPHELCVRLKPLALAALLDEGYSAALYLDADQWVLGDLEPLWHAVERSAIVLTPHLAGPAEGAGASARELMLLRAGTQNAGTVGVTDHPEARRMLAWWGERLDAANHGRVDEGAYCDQRWLDLVPGLFGGVEVLRDERFNVGYWSLPERDAADVRVLHASGFDPERPRTVTSHDPRLADVEAERVGALLERYAAELLAAGWREAARLPWGWARFDDGAPVPWMAGDVLSALGPDGDAFRAHPLASGPGTFQAWLATAADDGRPAITRLWIGIHGRRGDLREAFPDPLGADRDAFAAWIAREHGVAVPAGRRRWRHRR